jgi:FkbH-like protein
MRAAVDGQRPPDPVSSRALMEATDPALVRQAGRILARLRTAGDELQAIRIVVVATCTVGSFEHLLRAVLVGAGMLPAIDVGDYGAFEMTMATGDFAARGDPAGHQGSDPDIVALLMGESYFLPADWGAADLETFEEHVNARLRELRDLIAGSLRRTTATLLVHTIPLPPAVRDGFVSVRARARVAWLWYQVNATLLGLAQEYPQVAAVDLAGVMADVPAAARDARLHRYGDMPYTDAALLALAQQVRRVAQAKLGLSRKVLALDLDNTLWGGAVGEVGIPGIQLGGLYPGNCYLELQRAARRLREQGVVLVLASKNDADLVNEALTTHPEVLLRAADFSVSAASWSAKTESLRGAALSLGLPIRSFVFMDDSEFERGQMQSELADVAIISAAGDPAYLVDSLLAPGWFDVMTLTSTDRERPQLYSTRVRRGSFSTGFGSSEDFLRALDMTVEILPATDFTVSRIAQLAARTNQFNLTGIRFDEAATAAMSRDPGHLVASVSVTDRFGPEGIVGAIWVERGPATWRVLNLVLSCRVLGRGVELATAAWLESRASEAAASTVEGRFTRSNRNGVASDFWVGAGYTSVNDEGEFMRDLANTLTSVPSWIRLQGAA